MEIELQQFYEEPTILTMATIRQAGHLQSMAEAMPKRTFQIRLVGGRPKGSLKIRWLDALEEVLKGVFARGR